MGTDRYIAAVDFGSSKVALSVAKVDGDDVQVIYYKEEPSDGVRYSCVVHPRRVTGHVQRLILDAETELNIRIRQLVAGLPRYEVRQESASARVERDDPDSLITREEVNALKNSAVETYPVADAAREEIYGAVAQSFSADEDFVGVSEADIVGVTAETIEGNFKLFVGARKPVNNLNILFKDLGVALARKMFSPDAVAGAVLTESERQNGVALVEIGAGVTSLAIYRGKVLRHYSSIPFGGWSITNDIALECSFDDALAENLKLAYGACLPGKHQSLSEKILQIHDEETGSYEQLSLNYLSQIISCRVREIIEAVLYNIQESGYADKLRGGVVITGGGANLVNLPVVFKEMSGYKVRIGFPRRQVFSAVGCPQVLEATAGAAVGMILEAKRDARLNCAEDLEEASREEAVVAPAEEPVAAASKEEPVPGELFPQTGGGVVMPTGAGGKKTSDGKVVEWISRTSRRAEQAAKKIFEGTLGNLFDGMMKEGEKADE